MKTTALILGLAAWLTPTLALADMMSVSSQTASFRAGPSQKDKVLFSADLYYPVQVVEKKGTWTKVRDFEGETAWVTSQHLMAKPTVVIKADKANIREKANTDSDVLFQVERGEVFKVVDRKGNWVSVIDANKDGGWIRADMTWGLDEPKEDAASGDEEDAKPKTETKTETKTECTCVKKGGNEVARAEKSDAKAEKAEKAEPKAEKAEPKAEKVADKSEKVDAEAEPAAEKAEAKADAKAEKADAKAEKAKPEKTAAHDKAHKAEKSDKAEKGNKSEKAKPEKAQKTSSDKKKASPEKHNKKK